MHNPKYIRALFAFIVFLPSVLNAESSSKQDLALTIYSSADPAGFDPQQFIAQQAQGQSSAYIWQVPGFGVVKEQRQLELKSGINELRFTDVAQFIDPTTVSFTDLDDPQGTSILEQNFQFDLANPDKILGRYLDREISVVVQKGDSTETVSGTLISTAQNQIVLKTATGLQILGGYGPQIQLGDLPGGLITKPTLVWKLKAAKAGEHNVRTTYQTGGLTWRSDYNLVLNQSETKADLAAWVTLMNLSGISYNNARLKLIAGDVQRVTPQAAYQHFAKVGRSMALDEESKGFEEKSFFEYHLYTLPRKTDVALNATQQLSLFPTASGVNVEKVLVYYGLADYASWSFAPTPYVDRNLGTQSNKKVDVYIRFKNEEKNRMGMPLPKGKIRVYKQDEADGTLEFIGEDLIDHTPRDQQVMVKLGQAFDVLGERTQTDFNIDNSRRQMSESYKIEIKNTKDQEQRVLVKENLFRWMNWEISQKSDEFQKIDSRTIHFDLKVPARGSKIVTYTVKYSW